MNNIISKISEIEESASSIMNSANESKEAFAKEMKQKMADFDAALEEETAKELEQLRARMEQDMKTELDNQKADAEHLIIQLQELYDKNHTRYVKELFAAMIKE